MKHSKMWSEVVKQNRHPHGQFDEKIYVYKVPLHQLGRNE